MKTDIQLTKEVAPIIERLLKTAKCNACIVILLENLEGEGFVLQASNPSIQHEKLGALIEKIEDALDFEEIPLRSFN